MKILVFNNGYLAEGLSGGDKHVIDVAEVWMRDHDVVFMLPDFAAQRAAAGQHQGDAAKRHAGPQPAREHGLRLPRCPRAAA